jgi:cytochrome c peroxidase
MFISAPHCYPWIMRMSIDRWMGSMALISGLVGCATEPATDQVEHELDDSAALAGKVQFDNPLPHTNGRSCGTCHVEAEHRALSPQHVMALAASNPGDVLFNRIDADDPNAAVPTYDHLKAGLVRVVLPLAANLDVIDGAGNVVTNADRTIWVWRGVPSIENVGYTAPFQYDGRAPTLQVQASGALHSHSQLVEEPPASKLDLIVAFETSTFSSQAAADVADALLAGQTPAPLDLHLTPGTDAFAGQQVFKSICAKCHGTPTTHIVEDQAVFDSFFPVMAADGTIIIDGVLPTGIPFTAHFQQDVPRGHMGTYGISAIALLGQLGIFPNPSGLSLPGYRIRFYTDASRTQTLVDMPPLPPAIGPSLVPEPFSVDPGRAVISGDPMDWEGFDVPQLRGVAHTAPYFHDNSSPSLAALLDEYSRFILPADPVLGLPPIFPPEGPGLPPEALTPEQKRTLLAFLQLL